MSNSDARWSSVDKLIKDRVALVADSHPYLRSITRTILLQLGVKVTREVSDGFEAVEAICSFDPCAMILDWGIRGMDAREVVRVVRTSGIVPNPKIPIIAISGPIKRSKVVEAKDLGIDQLVLRPLSPNAFATTSFSSIDEIDSAPISSRCR
jgi:two-component system, chemotaxis family, chemotaxis protein CheY